MAGDWIKMRGNLWDDPRVARLVDLTDTSEAAVIGALYWLWATADQHTETGVMLGLSLRQIDRKTGIKGIGDALVAVGWVADHTEGIRIVNFEDHNGSSAKKRAQTAKRVAAHKTANAQVTPETETGNAPSVTETLAERDLEKRREEKSISEEEDCLYPATEIPEPSQAALVCLAMKAVGISDPSPGNPKLRALLDAGATVEEFVDAGRKAVGSNSGFRYALAVVENGRKAAAAMASQLHNGTLPAAETSYQRSMRERMAEVAPDFARKAPGQQAENATEFFNAIDVTARTVELLK